MEVTNGCREKDRVVLGVDSVTWGFGVGSGEKAGAGVIGTGLGEEREKTAPGITGGPEDPGVINGVL